MNLIIQRYTENKYNPPSGRIQAVCQYREKLKENDEETKTETTTGQERS
jgi:hypothetical protein